jgi:type IV pilus assembly protein PilM
MNLLPRASGTRPRIACDISPQGVVAAKSSQAGAPLEAVACAKLVEGAIIPSLKPGNIADRVAVAAAVRKALEAIGERPNTRGSDITLVLPDAAVRVLLLDFDSLPSKLSEALPLVRFRLKKMLPFDADDAMLSFQVMSTSKSMVRVLAVAIPRDVLREYEAAAREAGFEPGAVIPSTVAALAAVDDEAAALLVNANSLGVTAAIVRGGILTLHRSVDLQVQPTGTPANLPPALFDTPSQALPSMMLPLVDAEATAGEWAAQEALPEHGRNPYADRVAGEVAVQDEDSITELHVPATYAPAFEHAQHERDAPGSLSHSPYASPMLDAEFSAESHNSILIAPTSLGTMTEEKADDFVLDTEVRDIAAAALHEPPPVHSSALNGNPHLPVALGEEIAQAVSVAVAYFEDTLAEMPSTIFSAGPLGAEALARILKENGIAESDGLRVRELVETTSLMAEATTASVPRGWLAGVTGALRG